MEYDGYSLYFTANSSRAQLAVASVDGDAYAPADWWGGKTCTDWGRTQVVLNNSINAAGGPGQVVQYAHGVTAVNGAYQGGVLTSNGRIYLIPYNQSNQTNWHYIDTNTGNVVAYAHSTGISVAGAYNCGCLAPNGNIYMAPFFQSNSSPWHYINSGTGAVGTYTNGSGVTYNAYSSCVTAPDGKVWMIPYFWSENQPNWHYINTTNNTIVPYSAPSAVSGAYFGGVLASNGNIYMIPQGQATQSTWHYIRTSDNSIQSYTGPVLSASAYTGGVLAPNGKIFLIPTTQATQTTWHYIDSTTNSVGTYTAPALVNNAYQGGILAPNGRIYMAPLSQATQSTWHYIDTNTTQPTVVGYTHGMSGLNVFAYLGGILAPNGRIYLIPYGQGNNSNWHYIDTQVDKPLPIGVCTNPMFNKF